MKKLLVIAAVIPLLIFGVYSWRYYAGQAAEQQQIQQNAPHNAAPMQEQAAGENAVTITGSVAPASISTQVQYTRPTNDDRALLVQRGILLK